MLFKVSSPAGATGAPRVKAACRLGETADRVLARAPVSPREGWFGTLFATLSLRSLDGREVLGQCRGAGRIQAW